MLFVTFCCVKDVKEERVLRRKLFTMILLRWEEMNYLSPQDYQGGYWSGLKRHISTFANTGIVNHEGGYCMGRDGCEKKCLASTQFLLLIPIKI